MALGTTYLFDPTARLVEEVDMTIPLYNASVALAKGYITTSDLYALLELAKARFATRSQFRYLCYPLDERGELAAERRIVNRLQRLREHGLVNQVQWVIPGEPPRGHYAYTITMNAALILRDWQGKAIDWKPGMGNRQLKPILRQLAANEFRVQVFKEQRNLITDWRMLHKTDGPVAHFKLGDQAFVLDCPRDDEDIFMIRADRYARFMGHQHPAEDPIVMIIAPHERGAADLFGRLSESIPPERILFSTDERAFERSLRDRGYFWTWNRDGKAEGLALLEPAESSV